MFATSKHVSKTEKRYYVFKEREIEKIGSAKRASLTILPYTHPPTPPPSPPMVTSSRHPFVRKDMFNSLNLKYIP